MVTYSAGGTNPYIHYAYVLDLGSGDVTLVSVRPSSNINGTGNNIANVLTGNAGVNVLTGKGAADTFVWEATSHSTVAKSDLITDLSDADFIDLSAIDANVNADGTQHFSLVDAFTNTAGQVTLDFDGTFTNLRADTNGDGVADMLIRINGDHEDFDHFIFGG